MLGRFPVVHLMYIFFKRCRHTAKCLSFSLRGESLSKSRFGEI